MVVVMLRMEGKMREYVLVFINSLSDNDKSYHWGNFTDPSCFSDNHYLLLEIVVLSSLKRVHRFLSSSFAKRFVCNTDVLKTTSLLVQEFQLCFGPQLYCLPLHV